MPTPQMSDEELMSRYMSGDSSAFEEIYGRHSRRVYSFLLKKLGRRQEADEVLQTVFLKLHQSRAQYDPQYPVLQWLFVISKTAVVDFYRKASRQVPIANGVNIEHAEKITEPLPQSLDLSALDELHPDHRKAVEWRYLDDLEYKEIARRLGKTQENIRQIISRAIRKIRRSVQGKESEV